MDEAQAFAQWKAQRIKDICSDMNRPDAIILDYGCGDGLMTYYLQEVFFLSRVIGVDKPELIEQLKRDSLCNSHGMYVTEQELLSSKSIISSFDLVVLSMVLHHLSPCQQVELINKCLNYLKPQGAIVILEFNKYYIGNWFKTIKTLCSDACSWAEFKDLSLLTINPASFVYFSTTAHSWFLKCAYFSPIVCAKIYN